MEKAALDITFGDLIQASFEKIENEINQRLSEMRNDINLINNEIAKLQYDMGYKKTEINSVRYQMVSFQNLMGDTIDWIKRDLENIKTNVKNLENDVFTLKCDVDYLDEIN